MMQTGGLLKDLTRPRDRGVHRQPVRRHQAGRRGARERRHHRHRRPQGRPSARAASSSGCGSRWRCCPTRPCCCSTSRPPAWTSRAAGRSGPPSARDAEQGRTVLFATHYLEEADQYADRIVLISHGRIVADGTGCEIQALAAGRTVRATLPDADTDRTRRASAASTASRSAASTVLRARQGQRRRRPLPAHRDRRPRPRDHLQGPRGRLPQPDRPRATDRCH